MYEKVAASPNSGLMKLRHQPLLRLILIVLFIECLLFQWPAFISMPKTGQYTVPVESQVLVGFGRSNSNTSLLIADDNPEHSITVKLSGNMVRSLFLDAYSNMQGPLAYQVFVTDQASSAPYLIAAGQVVSGISRSRSLLIWPSRGVASVKIAFPLKVNEELHLNRLILNRKIPFQPNLLRILILLVLGYFCHALFTSPIYLRKAGLNDTEQRLIIFAIGFLIFLYCMWLTAAASTIPFISISRTSGDIYNKELTDALLQGRFDLLVKPPVELLNLANPYDPSQRAVLAQENILWNAAYFNGRYYVSYGIVPALLLFVPFKFLSSYYFQTAWAVFLFGALSLLLLVKILRRLLFVHFPNLAFRYHFILSMVVPAASFVGWGLARPEFYELAILSGFFFLMLGIDQMLQVVYGRAGRPDRSLISEAVLETRFNNESDQSYREPTDETLEIDRDLLAEPSEEAPTGERISGGRLFFACLSMALAIGCRPSLILTFIPLAFVLIYLLKRSIKTKQTVEVLLFSFVPILVVGALLALYNQARFGSFFEFGTQYQLTITDLRARGVWAPERLLPGIGQYLLTPPAINTIFPFVHFPAGRPFSHSAFFYTDGRVVGLLSLPFLSILLVWPLLRRAVKTASRSLQFILAGSVLTGLGLMMINSMSEGGLARWTIDFAFLLVIPAALVWLLLIEGAQKRGLAKWHFAVFLTASTITLFICLMLFLQGENDRIEQQTPYIYELLRRTLGFWLP